MKIRTCVSLDVESHRRFKATCERLGVTQESVVREAIADYVSRNPAPQPQPLVESMADESPFAGASAHMTPPRAEPPAPAPEGGYRDGRWS